MHALCLLFFLELPFINSIDLPFSSDDLDKLLPLVPGPWTFAAPFFAASALPTQVEDWEPSFFLFLLFDGGHIVQKDTRWVSTRRFVVVALVVVCCSGRLPCLQACMYHLLLDLYEGMKANPFYVACVYSSMVLESDNIQTSKQWRIFSCLHTDVKALVPPFLVCFPVFIFSSASSAACCLVATSGLQFHHCCSQRLFLVFCQDLIFCG